LRFLIKEAGDFTRQIGTLPLGARAFVDGPQDKTLGYDFPTQCGICFPRND
jgi:predicted ferric reductase